MERLQAYWIEPVDRPVVRDLAEELGICLTWSKLGESLAYRVAVLGEDAARFEHTLRWNDVQFTRVQACSVPTTEPPPGPQTNPPGPDAGGVQ